MNGCGRAQGHGREVVTSAQERRREAVMDGCGRAHKVMGARPH